MAIALFIIAATLLMTAATHLAICRAKIRAMSPLPGERVRWYVPFVFIPAVPAVAIAAYLLTPAPDKARAGVICGSVVLGIWLVVQCIDQLRLYVRLELKRERKALIRYSVAVAVAFECSVASLIYAAATGFTAVMAVSAAALFAAIGINLIVAMLHHRAIIQKAELS